uniref:Uncharacterized protein n=1 Tax=Siphoviridae sp. ct5jB2 TaxID=2825337 RepID=A0A8S5TTN2_9CAUD|nr:MAG TPA: hypothetical protein [Siphoviridae sp. ct5jB2]
MGANCGCYFCPCTWLYGDYGTRPNYMASSRQCNIDSFF